MIVAVTSDTHGRAFDIPPCDVFVHAGDFTAGGTMWETKRFLEPIREAILEKKVGQCILVPGNHDECFQTGGAKMRELLHNATYDGDGWEKPAPDRIHLLINEGIEIEGRKFWGSPYTPPFMHWWFMAEENKLAEIYKFMPFQIDMLITHGPPFGILDPGWKEPHVGSKALNRALTGRDIKHHVFGHLHAAGGKEEHLAGINLYNVAACDEAYNLVRQPIIIDI